MRKLTKKQKAKNAAVYKRIRKAYDKVKDKAAKPITYKQFKKRVLDRAEADKISIRNSIKKESRTETFLNPAERSRENLLTALKENYKLEYNELKNLSRSKGKFQSIKDNLTWDTERNGYLLSAGDKNYFIDVTNSPEEVIITEVA